MEGIYKVSGIKSKVQHVRQLYNTREAVQLSDFELPVITSLLNPLPLLFKSLLHGQKDRVFSGGIEIYLQHQKQVSPPRGEKKP
jgi:hypothetical protein